MEPRRLVELAGWLCVHSEALLESCDQLPDDALSEYWIASRCRLDKWGRELRRLGDSRSVGETVDLAGLAEEILISSVLSRAVGAITAAHDAKHERVEAGPIGRNAFEGHVEAISRAHTLASAWWPRDSPKARRLRSLSTRTNRWSDALLAHVGKDASIDRFASDVKRLHAFRVDRRAHGGPRRSSISALFTVTLRLAFASATTPSLNEDLNRRIGGSALALFGPHAFDSFGLPRSAWMIRLERSAEETEAHLEQVVSGVYDAEEPPLASRWRW